jgi:phosphoribosylaminoimidazole-succinocarboxamide synthase
MSKEDFQEVHDKALALFAFGQEVALKHGLLLVDTKYEFGKASDGSILLIDEVNLSFFFLTFFYGDMPHAD